jgi:hypothetical protein
MNTLRKKLTAIGLAGTVGLGTIAISSVPAGAAPVAPSQNTVKQSAPQQTEQVRRGRWIGPAVALGVIGAVAGSHYYHNRYYGYGPYYRPYRPAYYGYYGPRYYYGPGPYYYGW